MKNLKFILLFLSVCFSQVVINEVHYNPSLNLGYEDVDYEFIELYNNSDDDINLSGWSFASTEIHYTFSDCTISARDYVLLCRNSNAYEGCINHHGGALYNDGDTLYLLDPHHNYIDYVSYDDGSNSSHDDFPSGGDAYGPSIELIDPDSDNNHGSNWQSSAQINGTPGYQNSNGGDVEIEEAIEKADKIAKEAAA